MLVRNEVPVEALLKGSAAKVLLHLLAHQGEKLSNTEIMRGSGVHDRNTFFAAKKQLVEYGLWENPDRFFHTVGGNTHTVGIIPHTVGGNTHTVGGNTPTPLGVTDPTSYPALVNTDLPTDLPETMPEFAGPVEREWLAEAADADRMDDSGDKTQRNSPYQARRRSQLRVLRDLFRERFGRPLTDASAKRWLVLTEDSAEGVVEAIEYTFEKKGGDIQAPNGYIETVLKGWRDDAKRPRSSSTPAPNNSVPGANETEPDYYLSKPSERTAKVLARLKAAGKLVPDEDED